MSIDMMIILLLIAIAVVFALILLRSGREKRIYDPRDVDLGSNYDPQHDHFSKEHLEKLRKEKHTKPEVKKRNVVSPAVVAAKKREAQIHSSFEGIEHLKKPVHFESQQSKGHKNRRESSERRVGESRRHGERRSTHDRRGKES